jgi:ribosomal protein L23
MSSSRATNKLASERRRWWALAKRAQAEEALRRASRGGGAAALKGAPTPPNPNPKKREIHFPNLQLRLVAPSEEARMRGLEVATFITTPNVTKTEIKTFLTDVHGIEVLKVDTANYEGKKKRNLERGTLFRKPDYKKVYVTLGERWFPPERFCVPSK